MGICQCDNNTPTDMNSNYYNNEHNLILERDEMIANNNSRVEENTRGVKSRSSELRTQFTTLINKYGQITTPEAFNKILPEKYSKYSIENPLDLKYKEGINDLLKENPVYLSNGNYYWGYWNEKCEMCGPGQLYLPSENVYLEGLWKNGLLYKGRLLLPDNSIYEGKFEDCLSNGKGKLTYVDGSVYEGKFVRGKRHGNGSLYFPDGSKYWGEFANDQIEGNGDFLWCGGYEYKGSFKNNSIDGKGTLTLNQGSYYIGEFKNNQFHGKGKFIWKTGENYDGEYHYGTKEGKGTYSMDDNTQFNGKWFKNRQHGKGTIETETEEYTAYWRNGQMIEVLSVTKKDSNANNKNQNEANDIDFNFIPLIEDIDPNALPYISHFDLEDETIEYNNTFAPNQNIDSVVELIIKN